MYLFFSFLFGWTCGLWDLSFLTRDHEVPPYSGSIVGGFPSVGLLGNSLICISEQFPGAIADFDSSLGTKP